MTQIDEQNLKKRKYTEDSLSAEENEIPVILIEDSDSSNDEMKTSCENNESLENCIRELEIPAHKDLEDALYLWFLQARENEVFVNETVLKDKASTLNKQLGGELFKASSCWISEWKERKKIKSSKMMDKLSADIEAWNKYKTEFANILKDKNLTKAQVFNLDETGLSFKSLPGKMDSLNRIPTVHHSLKNQKFDERGDRVTIGVCSNADGSMKMRLIVIGYRTYHREMKILSNDDKLPVWFENKRNSSMDSVIFEDWFKTEFLPKVQTFLKTNNLPMRALLIVNNLKSNYKFIKIGEIETIFLPFGVKSVIHPQDETILNTLKEDYKFKLIKSVLEAQEYEIDLKDQMKDITIKDLIFWMSSTWQTEISSHKIFKYWEKIWPSENTNIFVITQTEDIEETTESGETLIQSKISTLTEEILNSLQSIKGYESISALEIRNWITTVDKWERTRGLSDLEIVAKIQREKQDGTVSKS